MLPSHAKREIVERMLKEGYSLREKSKWVSESIEDFLKLKEYQNLVEIAELVSDFANMETIYIPLDLEEKLEDAIIVVRKEYPALEGVKSLIIRASIVRRLVLFGKREQ